MAALKDITEMETKGRKSAEASFSLKTAASLRQKG